MSAIDTGKRPTYHDLVLAIQEAHDVLNEHPLDTLWHSRYRPLTNKLHVVLRNAEGYNHSAPTHKET